MVRLAILGAPRTGKTTLARTLAARFAAEGRWDLVVKHTDDLIGMEWSKASEKAATWFDIPGDLLVEGVAVARALRKWLAANPTGKPCDELLVLTETFEALTPGQASMGKGVHTVLAEIRPELERRGVRITSGKAPPQAAPDSGVRRSA